VQPGVAVFAILDDYSKFKDIERDEEEHPDFCWYMLSLRGQNRVMQKPS
jgi:hypothetical protein